MSGAPSPECAEVAESTHANHFVVLYNYNIVKFIFLKYGANRFNPCLNFDAATMVDKRQKVLCFEIYIFNMICV